MCPVEIYSGEKLIFITPSTSAETPIPDVPMIVNYSGDECGSIIALKDKNGDRMTDFPLAVVGEEKIMRFEQTLHLPPQDNRSGDVVVQKSLKFKRI